MTERPKVDRPRHPSAAEQRQKRLETALRENLKRRKAPARTDTATSPTPAGSPDGATEH